MRGRAILLGILIVLRDVFVLDWLNPFVNLRSGSVVLGALMTLSLMLIRYKNFLIREE